VEIERRFPSLLALRNEAQPPLSPSCLEDLPAISCCHPRSEAVSACAFQAAWLEGSFHIESPEEKAQS
jgi:hypothetical protein